MPTQFNIETEADLSGPNITLALNGKFGEDALPELEIAVSVAMKLQATVYLDLSEVTLVDRKAVEYLSSKAMHNVKLVNCPVYLRDWIAQGSENAEN